MNERRADFELLRDFVRQHDQPAFATVVRRHLDLVYATALRKVESQEAAEEIAQNVFATLARKAWQFSRDDSLPAWLYRTTLLEAKEWWRGEVRRRRREQTAAELGTTMKTPDEQPALRALLPLLDEALLSLREKDRTALLLRYYESQSLREVGAALNTSEDAAQKCVASALEKVAQFFQRRGFKTGTIVATAAALQHTATSAPLVVANSVVQAAMQAAPPAAAGLIALLTRFFALTKIQKAALCTALLTIPALWVWNANRLAEKAAAADKPLKIEVIVAREKPLRTETPTRQSTETAASDASSFVAPIAPKPLPEKEYTIHLRAIVGLSDLKAALLEVQHHTLDRPGVPPFVARRILAEGEVFDDASIKGAPVRLELLQVDSGYGNVRVRENGEENVHELEGRELVQFSPGEADVCIANIGFDSLVDLYGELMNRTVLCYPVAIKDSSISLATSARDRVEAAKVFERIFQTNGIGTVLDGDKFVLLVPTNLVKSISATVNKPRQSVSTAETFPAVSIYLKNVSLAETLPIYGALIGRRWIRSSEPPVRISFHNQTSLTKADIVYAFDTLFRWQNLKIVLVDDKSFKVIRVNGK